jgi:hypothetical protein
MEIGGDAAIVTKRLALGGGGCFLSIPSREHPDGGVLAAQLAKL